MIVVLTEQLKISLILIVVNTVMIHMLKLHEITN